MKLKGRVAVQFSKFKNPRAGQNKKLNGVVAPKRKKRRETEIAWPWTLPQFEELSKEDREIVMDRIQKEIIDALTIEPVLKSLLVQGVNQVAKLVAKREVRVVVFANNIESLVFGHLPLLCRLHKVPICVLHLSSKALGKLFGLKSLVCFGIKKLPRLDPEPNAEDHADPDRQMEGTPTIGNEEKQSAPEEASIPSERISVADRMKIDSITEFLIMKASKKSPM